MRKQNLLNVCLAAAILGAALGLTGPATAQGDVRTIPIPGVTIQAKPSPDGRHVAVYALSDDPLSDSQNLVADELPVRLVDLDSEVVTLLPGPADYASDVSFTSDGEILAGCFGNGQIVLWDTASQTQIKSIQFVPDLGQCMFLPNSRTLVVRNPTYLPAFFLWDIENEVITRILSFHFETRGQMIREMFHLDTQIAYTLLAFTISPDGRHLIMSTPNDSLWMWDIAGGPPLQIDDSGEQRSTMSIPKLAVTPDSATFVYLDRGQDPGLHVWNLESPSEIMILPMDDGRPANFALAPDGDRVAVIYRSSASLTLTSLSHPANTTTLTLTLPDMFMADVTFATNTRLVITGLNASETRQNALMIVDLPDAS